MLEEIRIPVDSEPVNPVPEPESQILQNQTGLTLEFRGSAHEYFKIWIVNLCLTLVTFGIFSAWAKVRKKRYIYSHTVLDGTPFQYLAMPIPILKGRIIAAAGFAVYWLASNYIPSLLPFVLIIGLVAAPWLLIKSAAFNARYSAFRNMNFHFEATYTDALKVIYVAGIVPAYVVGMMITGKWQIAATVILSIITGISFPWLLSRVKNLVVTHTGFGGIKGEFYATGKEFFGIYFRASLIVLLGGIPIGIFTTFFALAIKKDPEFAAYFTMAIIYALYIVAFAYVKSSSGNLVWNKTRIGPIRFRSTMRSKDLIFIYITNAQRFFFTWNVTAMGGFTHNQISY